MFYKIIIGLILFIAVSALGSGYFGEGFLDFQKKAKAARMVEFTRDVATVMQTYKAADPAVQSIVDKVDNNLGGLVDNEGEAANGTVLFSDVFNELKAEKLLSGTGLPEFGAFGVSHSTGAISGEDVVLINSTSQISDAMCAKINEVLGVSPATDYVVSGDVTDEGIAATVAAGATPSLNVAVDPTAVASILTTLYPAIEDGGVEGVCITDAGGNQNTFAFYVQEL